MGGHGRVEARREEGEYVERSRAGQSRERAEMESVKGMR